MPVFSQSCLINPNGLLILLIVLRTSAINRVKGGLFELGRSNHCRLFRLQFMGVEAARARRRQAGSKRYPVPDWTMLFVNGEKDFELVSVGVNFQLRPFQLGEFFKLLASSLLLFLALLCFALLLAQVSCHLAECSRPRHFGSFPFGLGDASLEW